MLLAGFLYIVFLIVMIIFYETLIRKGKIKLHTKQSFAIEVLGFYIPTLLISGFYTYLRTDTFKDTFIATTLIFLCLILIFIYLSFWTMKKYNYLVLAVIMVVFYFMAIFITQYMFISIDGHVYRILAIAIITGSMKQRNRGKIIIIGIIFGIIMSFPFSYLNSIEPKCKLERLAVDYAENEGFNIAEKYKIILPMEGDRNKKMRVTILYAYNSQEQAYKKSLLLIYLKDEFIELKEYD